MSAICHQSALAGRARHAPQVGHDGIRGQLQDSVHALSEAGELLARGVVNGRHELDEPTYAVEKPDPRWNTHALA